MAISVSFPFSWAAQPVAWGPAYLGAGFLYRTLFLTRLIPNCSIGGLGPTLLGAGFLYRILSPTGLVSKLTDFLFSPSYIIVERPLLLIGVLIALIQPVHGQGYNSDIPALDAPVIYIGAFPILTARPGRRSLHNTRPHSNVLALTPRGFSPRNQKREGESQIIASQNNAMWTNYVKTKIYTQQNSKCLLCGKRLSIIIEGI